MVVVVYVKKYFKVPSEVKTFDLQLEDWTKLNKKNKQAGAELCQAQLRLSWHYLVAS